MPQSPSSARVAQQYLRGSGSIQDVLDTLRTLSQLDVNLTEMEESFQSHFAAEGINPMVGSLTEALQKSESAVLLATQSRKAAEDILRLYPEDKTAQKAMEAADMLLKRFRKHSEDSRKSLGRIAKKELPKELKKASTELKRAIQEKLVHPEVLQVIPWVAPTNFVRGALATYYSYLVVERPGQKPQGIKLEQVLYAPNVNHKSEVQIFTGYLGGSFNNPTPYTLKGGVDRFTDFMRGWGGLQSEGAARVTHQPLARQPLANQIKDILQPWLRRHGGHEPVRITSDFMLVSGGFEGGTYWERESEYRYDEGIDEEMQEYKQGLSRALGSLKGSIRSLHTIYHEKGYWTVEIYLK